MTKLKQDILKVANDQGEKSHFTDLIFYKDIQITNNISLNKTYKQSEIEIVLNEDGVCVEIDALPIEPYFEFEDGEHMFISDETYLDFTNDMYYAVDKMCNSFRKRTLNSLEKVMTE